MISGYLITILITLVIYALLAHSLNIITGRAGQISLGHAAFFGIGAYTAAMFYTKAGFPFWLDIPMAGFVAGIVGAILGIPCLRVRDDFLAITTMGINFVIEAVFLYIPFFGGAMGIGGISLPNWFGREMTKPEYFILILIVFVLLLLLDRKLERSWIGLAWASIREDEQAAATIGVDIVRFKVLAFILGSAMAGLAGGFYAHFLTFIMPQNFGFGQSIVILCMTVFGGMDALGTYRTMYEVCRRFPAIMEYEPDSWGLAAAMRFQPGGLLGLDPFLKIFAGRYPLESPAARR
jgi:branched-chain amino acid transport system permease protein